MGASVQFKSKEGIMQAFQGVEVDAWSVWQHKQLLFKGIGDQDLSAFLDMLAENSTNAVYTVKWYEDITDKKQIKDNTPCDGSLNFKLNADGQEINQSQYGVVKYNNELVSRINGMEEKFNLLLDKFEGESEEPENKLGIIGDIIGHPSIAPLLPQLLSVVLGINNQPQPQQYTPAIVGNVPEDKRLTEAIQRLKIYDSKLADHLMKLATIAETDPNTFAMVMQTLDNYRPQ